ncbi:hypothetical protein M0804_009146 [Polistes exclamans]|nr:hypothetical protein M0804_009146 [Polistes exclamans]
MEERNNNDYNNNNNKNRNVTLRRGNVNDENKTDSDRFAAKPFEIDSFPTWVFLSHELRDSKHQPPPTVPPLVPSPPPPPLPHRHHHHLPRSPLHYFPIFS